MSVSYTFRNAMSLLNYKGFSKEYLEMLREKQDELLMNINFKNICQKIVYPNLPQSSEYDLSKKTIQLGPNVKCPAVLNYIEQMIPWRKGPFRLFGHKVESEWDSFQKWERILPYSEVLFKNKSVLDIGCQNAYYLMKVIGENAKEVVGVDKHFLGYLQACFCRILLNVNMPMYYIYSDLQTVANGLIRTFDTVMCLGVLTHQKNPKHFLELLKRFMHSKSFLVLETIVHTTFKQEIITIKDRYAGMRNCYLLPSIKTVKSWLAETGFKHIECIDVSTTISTEQRKTCHSSPISLEDHIDKNNNSLTIEGLPRPKRAIYLAKL